MDRSRLLDTIVVLGGLAVGFALPSALTRSPLVRAGPTPDSSAREATATVAPAVTFTAAPPTPRPSASATSSEVPSAELPSARPSANLPYPTIAAEASPVAGTATPLPLSPTNGPTSEPSAPPTSVTTPSLGAPSDATSTAAPSPATPSPAATPSPVVYVVRPGDTMFGIAKSFGVSPEAIAAANGLSDPNQLAAGQRLVIPPK